MNFFIIRLRQMLHIPIDSVRRDRQMSVCVCVYGRDATKASSPWLYFLTEIARASLERCVILSCRTSLFWILDWYLFTFENEKKRIFSSQFLREKKLKNFFFNFFSIFCIFCHFHSWIELVEENLANCFKFGVFIIIWLEKKFFFWFLNFFFL